MTRWVLQVETLRQQSCRQTISQLHQETCSLPSTGLQINRTRLLFAFNAHARGRERRMQTSARAALPRRAAQSVEKRTNSGHKELFFFCQTRVLWHLPPCLFFDCKRPPVSATLVALGHHFPWLQPHILLDWNAFSWDKQLADHVE